MKNGAKRALLLGLIGACIALTGCGNMTPQERSNAAAAFGAALGGAASAAAIYYDAKYSRPVYVAPQPVYVVPVRPATCWQSAVTGQWIGC